MCNTVAVGGTPRALTDCLNYGNPEIPEQLAELEAGVQGIAYAGKSITFDGEPIAVISGNVSLYNGQPDGSSIDPTAIVSCTGILPDARKAVTMQLKNSDSSLILIGERRDECGGSAYYQILEELSGASRDDLLGANVPKPDFKETEKMLKFILEIIGSGKALSCHDISNGGLLLAAFEMLLPQRKIGGAIGLELDLEALQSPLNSEKLLFSESHGFLVETSNDSSAKILLEAEKLGLEAKVIGKTSKEATFKVSHGENSLIHQELSNLTQIWQNGLKLAL